VHDGAVQTAWHTPQRVAGNPSRGSITSPAVRDSRRVRSHCFSAHAFLFPPPPVAKVVRPRRHDSERQTSHGYPATASRVQAIPSEWNLRGVDEGEAENWLRPQVLRVYFPVRPTVLQRSCCPTRAAKVAVSCSVSANRARSVISELTEMAVPTRALAQSASTWSMYQHAFGYLESGVCNPCKGSLRAWRWRSRDYSVSEARTRQRSTHQAATLESCCAAVVEIVRFAA